MGLRPRSRAATGFMPLNSTQPFASPVQRNCREGIRSFESVDSNPRSTARSVARRGNRRVIPSRVKYRHAL
jgi:hypothetical protein